MVLILMVSMKPDLDVSNIWNALRMTETKNPTTVTNFLQNLQSRDLSPLLLVLKLH